jgi:CBS domain-containing protein
MNISQIMSRSVETCHVDDSLAVAAAKMWERDIGCLPVVDADGCVVGMITDRDICMAGYTQGRPQHELRVASAMSRGVHSCGPNDGIIAAEETMRLHRVRRLPVLDP